jgi:CRP-like cAMP-binding protein
MQAIDFIGYGGAALMIITLAMKTMIPLRIVGILTNVLSLTYGLLAGIHPMAVQHTVLLPLNTWRLFEMRKLLRDVKSAAAGDLSLDWLKPYMARHPMRAGTLLFRKGEPANALYVVASGRCRLPALGIDIFPGTVVGELGMLTPGRIRTQDLECVEDGTILRIDYERIEQLYFQNPKFGFYFLRLASARLLDNVSRLERALTARDAEVARLRAALAAVQGPGDAHAGAGETRMRS